MMKEQNNNRNKWLHLSLRPEEYQKIYKRFSKSTCQKLSEYARKNPLDEPLIMNYSNQSLDEFMSEMIHLRRELKALGNNFNQAVKRLHTLQQIAEFKVWILSYEQEKKILFDKVEEIKMYIKKNYQKMVAIIKTVHSIHNIFNYNENKLKQGVAVCIGEGNYPLGSDIMNGRMKLNRFLKLLTLNDNVKHNGVHISLNFNNSEINLPKEKLVGLLTPISTM